MQVEFEGRGGVRLVGDALGEETAPTVLMLHGGGQTRHSWRHTAVTLAHRGYRAVWVDARGHGDSDWAPPPLYSIDDYAADVIAIIDQLGTSPGIVGASLGGLAALVAAGEARSQVCWALTLVDVAPRVNVAGSARIRAFTHAYPEGFASVDEAADAVALYLSHRPRPTTTSGLLRNLRLGSDGRYRWHWDPARFESGLSTNRWPAERFDAAASALQVPTLLVYGSRSEVIGTEEVDSFLALAPSATAVEIENAHHMVAGDENDGFARAIVEFLDAVCRRPATARECPR